jgi:energy-converting hydrogenase Eha subunit B
MIVGMNGTNGGILLVNIKINITINNSPFILSSQNSPCFGSSASLTNELILSLGNYLCGIPKKGGEMKGIGPTVLLLLTGVLSLAGVEAGEWLWLYRGDSVAGYVIKKSVYVGTWRYGAPTLSVKY